MTNVLYERFSLVIKPHGDLYAFSIFPIHPLIGTYKTFRVIQHYNDANHQAMQLLALCPHDQFDEYQVLQHLECIFTLHHFDGSNCGCSSLIKSENTF
jgi:hypothetical protein